MKLLEFSSSFEKPIKFWYGEALLGGGRFTGFGRLGGEPF